MDILFVITARGGSKGVPRKNIKKVGPLPLVAYKIIAAQKSNMNKRIIVSTDDEEIASVSMRYGAEVPFMRPMSLATDHASSAEVVEHAMNWVKENDKKRYDYICLLEPSSPFASYLDLNNAFRLISESNADTLLGMKEVDVNKVFIHSLDTNGGLSYFYQGIKELKSIRRQDQKKEYTMNGCMYIAKWNYFEKYKLFHSMNSVPYIMSEEVSIEIDTMLNYEMACSMVEKGIVDITPWMD
jgi:CMP-N-acetylneuraminic acid synthetase